MSSEADKLLIAQIRAGDEAAWEQCIARFEGRLLAFVRNRLRNATQAEDVVQDTFVGFLTSLPNFNPAQSIEAFLFSIASYKLTDILRREGRRPTFALPTTPQGGIDEPAGSDRRASSLYRSRELQVIRGEKLRRCLATLIDDWMRSRQFERLKCAELLLVRGWSNQKVAESLGISEQAVANHKYFVMTKLKGIVDQ